MKYILLYFIWASGSSGDPIAAGTIQFETIERCESVQAEMEDFYDWSDTSIRTKCVEMGE